MINWRVSALRMSAPLFAGLLLLLPREEVSAAGGCLKRTIEDRIVVLTLEFPDTPNPMYSKTLIFAKSISSGAVRTVEMTGPLTKGKTDWGRVASLRYESGSSREGVLTVNFTVRPGSVKSYSYAPLSSDCWTSLVEFVGAEMALVESAQ